MQRSALSDFSRPMLVTAAAFVLMGGFIHLREWLDTYRAVPASAPGAAMVRIGFPVNAAVSAVVALALVSVVIRGSRLLAPVITLAIAFEVLSLAFVIGSRTGTVLGWTEPVWTDAARQARAVEIGALLTLVAGFVLYRSTRLTTACAAGPPVAGRGG